VLYWVTSNRSLIHIKLRLIIHAREGQASPRSHPPRRADRRRVVGRLCQPLRQVTLSDSAMTADGGRELPLI
jgi:hypothetical protein